MSKYEFGNTSLVYSGHIVGGGQIRIYPFKVDVILKWPKPTNVIEVCSFLGVVQYWRRSISNFSIIVSPFHALKSMNPTSQWGGMKHKSIDTLKEKISITLIFSLPNLQKHFWIKIDAGGYAMGAMLLK